MFDVRWYLYHFFGRYYMSLLLVTSLPSGAFRDSTMLSAVSDRVFEDWGGTRKKLRFDVVSMLS